MAQEVQTRANRLESRYFKAFLVIVVALFLFGGPYLTFVFITILDVDYAISMISGFALIIIGLIVLRYLITKKIVL